MEGQNNTRSRLYKVPNEDLDKVIEELEEFKKKMNGAMMYSIKREEEYSYILVSYIEKNAKEQTKNAARADFRLYTDMMDVLMVYLYKVRKREEQLYWQREKENQEAILAKHYMERMIHPRDGFYRTR